MGGPLIKIEQNLPSSKSSQVSLLISKHSSLPRLLRIVAYLWRFVELRVYKCALRGDQPIAFEVNRALASCIMVEQKLAYEREFASLEKHGTIPTNSTLLRLKPFVGDDGLLRASSRIDRGDFPEDFRRPIILPPDSYLTRLIILNVHVTVFHSGTERVISELRKMYFIPSIRRIVRRILFSCFPCRRRSVKPEVPIMPALPPQRLQAFTPPFTNTGIDYFGQYYVSMYRRTQNAGCACIPASSPVRCTWNYVNP